MKSLISVTPKEFKSHFDEIMSLCAEIRTTTGEDVIITIPVQKGSDIHQEIARIESFGDNGSYAYKYNHELLKKYGIDPSKCSVKAKVEKILAGSYEKAGLAELARNNKKIAKALSEALGVASAELVKIIEA